MEVYLSLGILYALITFIFCVVTGIEYSDYKSKQNARVFFGAVVVFLLSPVYPLVVGTGLALGLKNVTGLFYRAFKDAFSKTREDSLWGD